MQASAQRLLMGPGPDRLVPALVAAWLVACALWSHHVSPAGYLASFDDVWRLVHANEASHGALAPSDVWPPLQFWIFGAALRAWPDATVVPRALGLLASAGTLLAVDRLAGAMGLGRPGRIAAVVGLGTLPAFVWIAPSALVEPLSLCATVLALLGTFRWWVEGRREGLVRAFVALAVAGALRFEAWGLLLALATAAALAPRTGRSAGRWLPLFAAGLVFPMGWCAWQGLRHGDPIHFVAFIRAFFEGDHAGEDPVTRLAAPWVGVWTVAWPVALAAGLGFVGSAHLRGRALVFGVPFGAAITAGSTTPGPR